VERSERYGGGCYKMYTGSDAYRSPLPIDVNEGTDGPVFDQGLPRRDDQKVEEKGQNRQATW
jgi:hypothetical protein